MVDPRRHVTGSDDQSARPIYHVATHAFADSFPGTDDALDEPNGLLAVGGDLSIARLLEAYRGGIFPWYSSGQPILWWSPNPRTVLFPERLAVSRSLRKTLRRGRFELTINACFADTLRACADRRNGQDGTWLLPEMIAAYEKLHIAGYAHSVESWQDGELVGGLYGVSLGRVFFGESMFSRVSDASKVCMVHLVSFLRQHGTELIDCQVHSDHLARLGAEPIARADFNALLRVYLQKPGLCRWPAPNHAP